MRRDLVEILIALARSLPSDDAELEAFPDPVNRALHFCRDRICSNKEALLAKARSTGAELSVLLSEVLLWGAGNPVPGLPALCKCIAVIGLERFCADPRLVLDAPDE